MKVTNFLLIVSLCVCGALFYVWQNIHQIELSYQIMQRDKIINNLIDHNRILKYNVARLKSPLNLERNILANHIELKYTKPRIIISELREENLSSSSIINKTFLWQKIGRLFSKVFRGRSEAEAGQ
ncbi:MAG: hypothetical protein AB7E08_02750 [Candidatus Omnitrophota bacterium]